MTYRLSIEILGEYDAVYSKGHHDFADFKAAYAADQGCLASEVPEPKHEWWRWRPRHGGDDSSYDYFQMEAVPHARGAFPVTVSWERT